MYVELTSRNTGKTTRLIDSVIEFLLKNLVNNIFSEKEVNDMINLYTSNMNILQSSITILKNSIV